MSDFNTDYDQMEKDFEYFKGKNVLCIKSDSVASGILWIPGKKYKFIDSLGFSCKIECELKQEYPNGYFYTLSCISAVFESPEQYEHRTTRRLDICNHFLEK